MKVVNSIKNNQLLRSGIFYFYFLIFGNLYGFDIYFYNFQTHKFDFVVGFSFGT